MTRRARTLASAVAGGLCVLWALPAGAQCKTINIEASRSYPESQFKGNPSGDLAWPTRDVIYRWSQKARRAAGHYWGNFWRAKNKGLSCQSYRTRSKKFALLCRAWGRPCNQIRTIKHAAGAKRLCKRKHITVGFPNCRRNVTNGDDARWMWNKWQEAVTRRYGAVWADRKVSKDRRIGALRGGRYCFVKAIPCHRSATVSQ